MATGTFLAEFPPVSTEQWEHLIREKITGAEYASKLIWHPEEGLALKPYYRSDDLDGLQFLDAPPGAFPFVRGTRADGNWRIREEIDLVDVEDANRAACSAVAAGAEEIAFHSTKLENARDLATLFANLHEVPIMLVGAEPAMVRLVIERASKRPHGASISADLDPLADLDLSAELIRNAHVGLRPFVIHGDEFQESGAGAVEELGFVLSAAVDFVSEMQERGLPVDRIATSVFFSFAIGPKFFIQIAKLRAFRLVWAKAIESFGAAPAAASPIIHARTALWNATLYDARSNALRATTEVMSAVLGGADSILVVPFDSCFRTPDESSRRLARNTQILLKQEAMLSRVADPLGGSYLIEALTHSIASKAWKLFQELEAAGGYQKASSAGVIASVLEKRMSSREEAVACRRSALTGTNRFADPAERVQIPVDAAKGRSAKRAAHALETLRQRTEQFVKNTGAQPRILLAKIGDAKMRNARAQFVADCLSCAGLVANEYFFEATERIAECEAEVIVLCSSDIDYLSIASELMQLIKSQNNSVKIVVAGNPDTAEQLKNLGIVDFIHLRSNAVEVLGRIQQLIGIKN